MALEMSSELQTFEARVPGVPINYQTRLDRPLIGDARFRVPKSCIGPVRVLGASGG